MLRPHETPLDIPLTLAEGEDPALQLFATEGAATGNQTGPSVSRPAGSSVALDETLQLTHHSHEPDFGAGRLAMSLGPSRLFVGALLSAPAVLFLAAWFVAGSSSTRRAAIEAAQRLRSEMAPPPAREPNQVTAAQPSSAPESQAPAASAVAAGTAMDTLQSAAPPAAESETRSSEPASRASRRTSEKALSATGEPLAGTLSIDSRPIGASVFIDEQLVGTTPMLLPQISPGAHSLRLHLDAHRDWTSTVQIDPGARNRVTAGLEEGENVPVGANLR